jgi:hypothetical protein
MAKLTIENCWNEEPHEAHTYVPGIFRRRAICYGIKPPKPEHTKHKYVLQFFKFTDPRKLVWHCECGKFISMYRREFYRSLKDANYYPVRVH